MKHMIVRIVSLTLAAMFILPAIPSSAVTRFADVSPDYWAYNEINYLVGKQIIRGKDGKFAPEDPIKRIQAAEMLVKALGLSTENRPNPNFKDMKPGDYGYQYAATLAAEGIMTGSNGYFKPWDTLTRGQMAKILSEAYDLMYAFGTNFKDVPSDSWVYDYVSCLVDNHVTTGYADNTYRPNAKLKRAQFSAFMARILDDSFKQTVLFKALDYEWSEDGGLSLLVEIRNNYSYPVKLIKANVAVTSNDEFIADGTFEFNPEEIFLEAKQSQQIVLSFPSDLVYYVTDLTDIVVYTQTEINK
ncbi:S-layer family protein [Anoxybacillus vitaminiphilus]|uniref:S-layer family protein n=1 Tax=Paranoxybacillus vitaminiphilus TaxID=581036 RepID=A0A327YG82_9BACL|nr:S-layer homology domain-containing protein [Anoxybacillus vitaminiphilus]RAK19894.1 S-layer family protein [Anoxybacillus vitaminiphilus]